jgi:hypothetical protein
MMRCAVTWGARGKNSFEYGEKKEKKRKKKKKKRKKRILNKKICNGPRKAYESFGD